MYGLGQAMAVLPMTPASDMEFVGPGRDLATAQSLLRSVGYSSVRSTGTWDSATLTALNAFARSVRFAGTPWLVARGGYMVSKSLGQILLNRYRSVVTPATGTPVPMAAGPSCACVSPGQLAFLMAHAHAVTPARAAPSAPTSATPATAGLGNYVEEY